MTQTDRQAELTAEVNEMLDRYIVAFEKGGLEEVSEFMVFPMAYIGDDKVSTLERYPFDPVRLREKTGFHHTDSKHIIIGVDEHKAHVNIRATRYRADNTPIETVNAIYILLKIDGDWKIAVISGIRAAKD
jgi:hypothetical protein